MEYIRDFKLDLWLIQTVAMILTAVILPGFTVSGPISAFLSVVCLGVVNTYLWDAALFYSVPDSVSLHALIMILANGGIFWLLVKILPGIDTRGLLAPLVAPVIFTVSSMLLHHFAKDIEWEKLFTTAKSSIVEAKEELKREHHAYERQKKLE